MTQPKEAVVSPGSLFNSSEGILSTALTGLVTTVVTTGDYSETLQIVAIAGLALSVATYTFSRAWVKRNA